MADPQISPEALARQTAAAKYGEHIVEQAVLPLLLEKIDIYKMVDPAASSEIVIKANAIGALMTDLIASACANATAGHADHVLAELKRGFDKAWEQRAAAMLDGTRKFWARYNG